jgi:hypothetical protein
MMELVGGDFDKYRVSMPPEYMKHVGIPQDFAMGDRYNGCFIFPSPIDRAKHLRVMAGVGDGWDHVSVSLVSRCPVWEEMEWIKRRFFRHNEVAYQLHVTSDRHINRHPFTLHLWRPLHVKIPMPPSYMV